MIFTQKKAQAVLPLAPIVIGALETVVAEKAVEYGIGFVDKQLAKSTSKNIATKIYNKYAPVLGKVKPTKKGLGKLLMSTGGYILAEIIDELGDLKEDTANNGDTYNYIVIDNSNSWQNDTTTTLTTAGGFSWKLNKTLITDQVKYNVFKTVLDNLQTNYEPTVNDGKFTFSSCLPKENKCDTNTLLALETAYYKYNPPTQYYQIDVSFMSGQIKFDFAMYRDGGKRFSGNSLDIPYNGSNYITLDLPVSGFINNGVIVHGDMINRYDTDDKTAEQLMNVDWSKSLGNLDLELDLSDNQQITDLINAFEDGIEIDLEDSSNIDLLNLLIGYLENKEVVSIDKPIQTDSGLTDDIINQIIIINNPPVGDDDGDDDDGDSDDDGIIVKPPDGSILQYVKNSYDYAVNALKVSVDGLKSIVAGSAGLIALYSKIFDWLPDEVTVILTSGLLLMIGLRVFRK